MPGYDKYKDLKKNQEQQNNINAQENLINNVQHPDLDQFYAQKQQANLNADLDANGHAVVKFGYDADQLMEKFGVRTEWTNAEDFRNRTDYYFKDNRVANAKVARYRSLERDDDGVVDAYTRNYSYNRASKRKQHAGTAAGEFAEMSALMDDLRQHEDIMSVIAIYELKERIMDHRIKGMVAAAYTKAKSKSHMKYLENRAKLSCYMILKEQLEQTLKGLDPQTQRQIRQTLEQKKKTLLSNIKSAYKGVKKYAPKTMDVWREKNGLNSAYYSRKRREYRDEHHGLITSKQTILLSNLEALQEQNEGKEWPYMAVLKENTTHAPINKAESQAFEYNRQYRTSEENVMHGQGEAIEQDKRRIKEADMEAIRRFNNLHVPTFDELGDVDKYLMNHLKDYYELCKKALPYYNRTKVPAHVKEYMGAHPEFMNKLRYLVAVDTYIDYHLRSKHMIEYDRTGVRGRTKPGRFKIESDDRYRYKRNNRGGWTRDAAYGQGEERARYVALRSAYDLYMQEQANIENKTFIVNYDLEHGANRQMPGFTGQKNNIGQQQNKRLINIIIDDEEKKEDLNDSNNLITNIIHNNIDDSDESEKEDEKEDELLKIKEDEKKDNLIEKEEGEKKAGIQDKINIFENKKVEQEDKKDVPEQIIINENREINKDLQDKINIFENKKEDLKEQEDKKNEIKEEKKVEKQEEKKDQLPKINTDVFTIPELEGSLEEAYKKLDAQLKNEKVSPKELEKFRNITKERYNCSRDILATIPKSLFTSLTENPPKGIDVRALMSLLRPVRLNKFGYPETDKDAENLKLNIKDCEALKSNKLSDRKDFLDNLAKEAKALMYTPEQLMDHDFIRKDMGRAMRHLSFMHNLTNIYKNHAGYFLNKAPEEIRTFMFGLISGTDYVNFASFHIQQAIYGDNGLERPFTGASSAAYSYVTLAGKDLKTVRDVNKKISKMSHHAGTTYAAYYNTVYAFRNDPNMDFEGTLKSMENQKRTSSAFEPAAAYIYDKEYGKTDKTISTEHMVAIMSKYLKPFAAGQNAKDTQKAQKELLDLIGIFNTKINSAHKTNTSGISDDLPDVKVEEIKDKKAKKENNIISENIISESVIIDEEKEDLKEEDNPNKIILSESMIEEENKEKKEKKGAKGKKKEDKKNDNILESSNENLILESSNENIIIETTTSKKKQSKKKKKKEELKNQIILSEEDNDYKIGLKDRSIGKPVNKGVSEGLEEMKRLTGDKSLTKEDYILYQEFLASKKSGSHPEITEAYRKAQKNLPKSTQGLGVGRAGAGIMRLVHYDEKGIPASKRDRENHAWNLTWFKAIEAGDTDKQKEMLDADLPHMLDNMQVPEPEMIEKWIETEVKKNPAEMISAIEKFLLFDNMRKTFPEIQDYLDEHPLFNEKIELCGRLTIIFNNYMKEKFGCDDQGNLKDEKSVKMNKVVGATMKEGSRAFYAEKYRDIHEAEALRTDKPVLPSEDEIYAERMRLMQKNIKMDDQGYPLYKKHNDVYSVYSDKRLIDKYKKAVKNGHIPKEKTSKGKELSGAPGALLRMVHYDNMGNPIGEQDCINMLWNNNVMAAFEKGDTDTLTTMINDEFPNLFEGLKIPAPSRMASIYWFESWFENEFRPDAEKWFDVQRRQASLKSLIKANPKAKKLYEADKQLQSTEKAFNALMKQVSMYLKYRHRLDIEQQGENKVMKPEGGVLIPPKGKWKNDAAKQAFIDKKNAQKEKEALKDEQYKKDMEPLLKDYKASFDQIPDSNQNKYVENEDPKERLFRRINKQDPKYTRQSHRIAMEYKRYLNIGKTNPLMTELYQRGVKKKNYSSGTSIDRDAAAGMKFVNYDADYNPISEQDKKNHEWNKKWLKAWEDDDMQVKDEMMAEMLPDLYERMPLPPEPTEEELKDMLEEDFTKAPCQSYLDKLEKWALSTVEKDPIEFSLTAKVGLSSDQIRRKMPGVQKFLDDNQRLKNKSDVLDSATNFINAYIMGKYHIDDGGSPADVEKVPGHSERQRENMTTGLTAKSMLLELAKNYQKYNAVKNQPLVPYKMTGKSV
jgi:hypothetical protein